MACECARSTSTRACCSRRSKRSRRRDRHHQAVVVLLTPGMYNSAYFEHSYLAQQMGIAARRGARPGGRGRSRVDAHHQRARAGWTSSTAASTTTFSTRTTFRARLDARRARAGGRLPGRPRLAGQRARQRRRRRQGDVRLRAGHDPLLPGRGADHSQRAHLPVLARRGPAARTGQPREAGGEGRQRSPAATACSVLFATRRRTVTTGRWRCRRRSLVCGRRRTAARRSGAMRSISSPPGTSSTGSRIRTGQLPRPPGVSGSRPMRLLASTVDLDRRADGRPTRSTSSSSPSAEHAIPSPTIRCWHRRGGLPRTWLDGARRAR